MKGQQVGFQRYWNRHTVTPLEPHSTVLPLQSGIPAPTLQTSLCWVQAHDTALHDEINDDELVSSSRHETERQAGHTVNR